MNEENKLVEGANGEMESMNPADKAMEQAETNRQKALKRARARKADRNFDDNDDEALWGALNEDADADAAELDGYRKDTESLNDFLRTDEKAAGFLSDWRRNGSPIPALVRDYGEEIVKDMTNPENQEMVAKSQKEYLDNLAKSKELEAQYDNNIDASQQLVDRMKAEYGEDKVRGAVESLGKKFAGFLVGQLDEKTIMDEMKALGYDEAVADAKQEGEVKGRNEQIGKEMTRRRKQTDGLPAMSNAGNTASKKEDDRTGALGMMAGRRSMWD